MILIYTKYSYNTLIVFYIAHTYEKKYKVAKMDTYNTEKKFY